MGAIGHVSFLDHNDYKFLSLTSLVDVLHCCIQLERKLFHELGSSVKHLEDTKLVAYTAHESRRAGFRSSLLTQQFPRIANLPSTMHPLDETCNHCASIQNDFFTMFSNNFLQKQSVEKEVGHLSHINSEETKISWILLHGIRELCATRYRIFAENCSPYNAGSLKKTLLLCGIDLIPTYSNGLYNPAQQIEQHEVVSSVIERMHTTFLDHF